MTFVKIIAFFLHDVFFFLRLHNENINSFFEEGRLSDACMTD